MTGLSESGGSKQNLSLPKSYLLLPPDLSLIRCIASSQSIGTADSLAITASMQFTETKFLTVLPHPFNKQRRVILFKRLAANVL